MSPEERNKQIRAPLAARAEGRLRRGNVLGPRLPGAGRGSALVAGEVWVLALHLPTAAVI
eukprot:COSAG06_NODE_48559_length_331_cov_0.741379_1_plen_59_part_10